MRQVDVHTGEPVVGELVVTPRSGKAVLVEVFDAPRSRAREWDGLLRALAVDPRAVTA